MSFATYHFWVFLLLVISPEMLRKQCVEALG